MHYLLYKSDAVDSLGSDEVFRIIESSARRNPARDVTGFLVFEGGKFLQYIEGSEESLEGLLEVLNGDRRHTDIQLLSRGTTAERSFPNWRMERMLVRRGETGELRGKLMRAGVPAQDADAACELFKAA